MIEELAKMTTVFNNTDREYLTRILQNTFEPIEYDPDNVLRDLLNALRNGDTIEFDED